MMGGQIGCRSKLGYGSTFFFASRLPLAPKDYIQAKMKKRLKNPSGSSSSEIGQDAVLLANKRILLVEDNLINQKVGIRMLESMGCLVEVAENGNVCLEKLKQQCFDLILMDCQMPEMDGFEATAIIREIEKTSETISKAKVKHVPIVALTASATTEYKQKCIACGMDDFLAKVR